MAAEREAEMEDRRAAEMVARRAAATEAAKACLCEIDKSLLDVLRCAGATSHLLTIDEILYFFEEYTKFKNLINPHALNEYLFAGDPLERVFGTDAVKNTDFWTHVLPLLRQVTPARKNELAERKAFAEAENKRPRDSPDTCVFFGSKPMYLKIPVSPDDDSSPESESSVQGYETALAKDSSDDMSFLDESDGGFSDTKSGVGNASSDPACYADYSDTGNEDNESSESDPEIMDGDKWRCDYCSALNRPLKRFCMKCWKVRSDWLPDKRVNPPRTNPRRLRRSESALNERQKVVTLKKSVSLVEESSAAGQSGPTPMETSPEPANLSATCSAAPPVRHVSFAVPGPSTSRQGTSTEPRHKSVGSGGGGDEGLGLCMVCMSRPRTSILIHGKIGHQACCYGCANKLWARNKKCPVCRRDIQKVIRNFIV